MDMLDKIVSNEIGWHIRDLLRELKERRDSDLRPADKFLNNTINKQFEHIKEEHQEVIEAFDKFSDNIMPYAFGIDIETYHNRKTHLCEELVDLQMSCETMLAILGLDEQQRQEARRKVIAKNEARGHYQVDSKEAE